MNAHCDTPDLLLDAADRLLRRYGYTKMTMDDVAREAGVGKGSIYLHFRCKEDLALGCFDRANQCTRQHLSAIAHGPGLPEERLVNMLVERVLFRFDRVQGFTESLDEIYQRLRPALLARKSEYLRQEALLFAEVLREGVERGALHVDDIETGAYTLLWATNALLPYSLTVAELGARTDVERRASAIADMLLNGLRVEAARNRPAQEVAR